MNRPVRLRQEAIDDADEIRAYLAQTDPERKVLFERHLREVIERIEQMPLSFGLIWKNYRAVNVGKSRYVVYFRTRAKEIDVLAIMHSSRSDAAWKARTRRQS